MEWELLPKANGTPVHIHPSATERYRVLKGQLDVYVETKWQLLQVGDTLTVPKGTPHMFRNPADTITRVYNSHAPAMQFDAYFDGLSKVVHKLSAVSNGPLKVTLYVATYLSMLMMRYPAEIVSVNPPGLIVALLNRIGKLRGIKV